MSFLKKFGTFVAKGLQIVMGISGPVGQQFPGSTTAIGKFVGEFTAFAAIIGTVEAIGAVLGLAGPDKLKAAAPLIAQAILQSEVMTGKKIAQPGLFSEGCTKIADGVVAVLNSLSEKAVVVVETKP